MGQSRNLTQELPVGDDAAFRSLIGLVDDGGLIRGLQGMAVHAVEAGIEPSTQKPGDVAVDQ